MIAVWQQADILINISEVTETNLWRTSPESEAMPIYKGIPSSVSLTA